MRKIPFVIAILLASHLSARAQDVSYPPPLVVPSSVTDGGLLLWSGTNGQKAKDGGTDLSSFSVTPTGGSANTLANLLGGVGQVPAWGVSGVSSLASISITGNLAGVNPCASDGNYGWNFENGSGEMDAISCYTANIGAGNDAFAWFQKPVSGALTKIMNLDKVGNLALPGGLTVASITGMTTPLSQAQGGTGATSGLSTNGLIIDQTWGYPTGLTSGSTYTATAQRGIMLNYATLALLTVTLPPSPVNGQEFDLTTLGVITGLTVQSGTGGAGIVNAPTTAAAGSNFKFTYQAADNAWWRTQ
jgi:hypothetical protein